SVRRTGDEITPDPIRGSRRCRIGDGGAHPPALARTPPTHLPHDPFHDTARYVDTVGVQYNPCLTSAQDSVQTLRLAKLPDRIDHLRIGPVGFRGARTGVAGGIRRRGDRDAVLGKHSAHRLDTPLETINAHPHVLVGADELHDY